MRIYVLLLFFLFVISSSQANDIYALRQLYYEAAAKKESAKKFLSVMERMNINSAPILLCYAGMANLIQANYSLNPYTKLACFHKGRDMLEKAIASDPKNIEMRFMRFCVQTNAPFFLRYNDNIDSDKEQIIKYWNDVKDLDLKEKMKKFMIESDSCSANEKNKFR